MAKFQSNKDLNKILVVIGVIILAAATLVLLSTNKSNDYKNDDGGVVISEAPQSYEEALTAKEWLWVSTNYNDDSTVEPSASGTFAANFLTGNRFFAATDCNSGNSSYELGADNSLEIGPMASTLMACEGSNELEYFQQLQEVQSYFINEEGNLVLLLQFDSGSMIFE